MSTLEAATKQLEVFYDGACPLCRGEIEFYKRQRGANSITWHDISNAPDRCEIAAGLSKEEALARFHVQESSGTIFSGGSAFAKVWTVLPLFYPVGKLFEISAFSWMLELAYSLFLRFRRRP